MKQTMIDYKKCSIVFFTFVVCLVSINTLKAQSWEWLKTAKGASGNQTGKFIGRDTIGNLYIVGNFTKSISFGTVQFNFSSNSGRVFVAKYDSAGTFIWARVLKDSNFVASDASFSKSGQIAILLQIPVISTILTDGSLVSYDNNGTLLFELPTLLNNLLLTYTRFDNQNNLYIVCNTGNISFVSIGGNSITSNNSIVCFKLDKNGTNIFSKILVNQFSTTSFVPFINLFHAFDVDSNFLYIIFSPFKFQIGGDLNFGNGISFESNSTISGSFFAKYDLNGNAIEAINYDFFIRFLSSSFFENSTKFHTLKVDNVTKKIYYLFNVNNIFDVNGAQYQLNNGEMILLTLGFDKKIKSVKVFGGNENDLALDMDLDKQGNVYISGFYNKTATFGSEQLSSTGQNGFVIKLDTAGNTVWAKNLGSGSGDYAYGIVADPEGTVYTTGMFYNNAIFDEDTLKSSGFGDAFVGKLSCVPRVNPVISGDTLVCLGLKNYSVTGTAGVLYVWSVSGGGSISSSGNSISINWSVPGFYTLRVTPTNACGSGLSRSIKIRVKDIPSLPSIIGNKQVCLGTNAYNISAIPEENYTWSISGGGSIIPINNTAVVNWVVTGNYNLIVQPRNFCGNGPKGVELINVGNLPQRPSTIAGSNTVCLGNSVYFINSIAGESYNWSLSSGGSLLSQGALAQANWLVEGTHLLSVTPSNRCGTGPTQTTNVQVSNVPSQPSAISGNINLCPGIANYTVSQNPNTLYNWSISGGGVLFPSGNNAQINWIVPGKYAISVSPFNQCGIGTTRSLNVNINTVPIQTSAILGLNKVCLGAQSYTVPLVPNVNYQWSVSSGGTINSSANAVIVNWQTPGIHTLSVTPFNNCGFGNPTDYVVTVSSVSAQIGNVIGNKNP